ncbi:MAG: adenosylcobinamide-GDP ribazoletransferase [Bacteroidaceae bacterium]|nr:adenosylcobinamide-GDP ribazoletransferase [Bacteroidaceae bacterium]
MKSILAAFVFFTRFPLWRWVDVSGENFSRIIPYWPLVGWVTGGLSAATLFYASHLFPVTVAVVLALVVRLLLTGALHEDGLADFFDGFGGGGANRERILAIMKDSHIGTYGVIALIFYFLFSVLLLSSLPLVLRCSLLLVADPLAKGITGMMVNILPYARPVEQCKSGILYAKMPGTKLFFSLLFALLPVAVFFPVRYWPGVAMPAFAFFALIVFLKKKIGGYTGDCCGAIMLLCELSFYIITVLIYSEGWK